MIEEPIILKEGKLIRLHITRHTNYGERYKLFTFKIEKETKKSIEEVLGFKLEKSNENKLEIAELAFMGLAEKKGIDFYDELTKVEISNERNVAKEYIYILGLIFLFLVFYSQKRNLSKNKS